MIRKLAYMVQVMGFLAICAAMLLIDVWRDPK